MKPKTVTMCLLALLLCSCTGTFLKQTWKAPDYHSGPVGKIAALAVDNRGDIRQGFENRFVKQLRKRGEDAMTTYDILSLPEIQKDKPAAAARLQQDGAQAVLMLRLVNMSSTVGESRGRETYLPTLSGFETMGFYDYYSVSFMRIDTSYGSLKQRVYLETALFDLKTGKRVWAALTETIVTDTMDRIPQVDAIVSKAVGAMHKDGMIR